MKTITSILLLIPLFLESRLPLFLKYHQKEVSLKVSISVYNPSIGQCDSSPLLTASGHIIDTNLLKQNKLKWCAVSRNFLKRFNKKAQYNLLDTIIIDHILFKGKYIITDVTKDIYYNRVDVLHYNLKYCHSKSMIGVKDK